MRFRRSASEAGKVGVVKVYSPKTAKLTTHQKKRRCRISGMWLRPENRFRFARRCQSELRRKRLAANLFIKDGDYESYRARK